MENAHILLHDGFNNNRLTTYKVFVQKQGESFGKLCAIIK